MNDSIPDPQQRQVRSFVRREGRLTLGQRAALTQYWPHYGLDWQGYLLDLDQAFGRIANRVVEIGFGDGASLLAMAQNNPETDFLGIEVHRPGVGHLLREVAEHRLSNVRVIAADAVEVLRHGIAPTSLDRVQIFFPDPWPKKRHHKRRLIQPPFLALLATVLKSGGIVHVATDWEPYADHILTTFQASPLFVNLTPTTGFLPARSQRLITKFEYRGQRLGHQTFEVRFQRVEPSI